MTGLRAPDQVMRLARLGAAHQTRLSFMRVLLRGLRRGGWQIDRPKWQVDSTGVGHAVYRARGQGQCYSLVAFAHDLPPDQRSDRVIAEAWDATFALVDGEVTENDIARLAANVPLQEAGRVSDRELVLSRANRSVRLWDHVVGRLAQGQQPDPDQIEAVGYLMRTTAVYGSGKFGAADRSALAGRPLMDGPFRAEMLTVWLIRTFVVDLADHMARAKGGAGAVPLKAGLRRRLGIGNSTGLGMAPFLVNHPALLNAWITAKETALARVRALPSAAPETQLGFAQALEGANRLVASWHSAHPIQQAKLADLRADIDGLQSYHQGNVLSGPKPWDALWHWGQAHLSTEGQELLLSLMLEPHGALVDDLAETMGADEGAHFRLNGAARVDQTRSALQQHYAWALDIDHAQDPARAQFWYVSEAKLEPRLGKRASEPGADLEQPLHVARDAAVLADDLAAAPSDQLLARFLAAHPQHRRILRRLKLAQAAPYSEIRDNLTCDSLLPLDMLRCKLAFFGATRFDPRSDRWVRITMFQDAPLPDELHLLPEDAWVLPGPLAA